jgi:hypothetical protein
VQLAERWVRHCSFYRILYCGSIVDIPERGLHCSGLARCLCFQALAGWLGGSSDSCNGR